MRARNIMALVLVLPILTACKGDDDEISSTVVAVTGSVAEVEANSVVISGTLNVDKLAIANFEAGVELSQSETFSSAKTVRVQELIGRTFTVQVSGLLPEKKYWYRTYVKTSALTYYGEAKTFTTKKTTAHAWVDLGLPSGTLWATCNVGANSPEEYGDYFAWGETEPKMTYGWSTYKYCKGDYDQLTKYCTQSKYGYNGFTDTLTELEAEDDAATANWGSGWQMPNHEQMEELINSSYTTTTSTTQNGVSGRKITGKNGKSIFLPAAGCIGEKGGNTSQEEAGFSGYYWSRSLYWNYSSLAYYLGYGPLSMREDARGSSGFSVRPVRVQN